MVNALNFNRRIPRNKIAFFNIWSFRDVFAVLKLVLKMFWNIWLKIAENVVIYENIESTIIQPANWVFNRSSWILASGGRGVFSTKSSVNLLVARKNFVGLPAIERTLLGTYHEFISAEMDVQKSSEFFHKAHIQRDSSQL